MAGKLYILGLGVDPIDHTTVEVLQSIGECERLYVQGLEKEHIRYLSRFCDAGRILPVPEGGKPETTVRRILDGTSPPSSAGGAGSGLGIGKRFVHGDVMSKAVLGIEKPERAVAADANSFIIGKQGNRSRVHYVVPGNLSPEHSGQSNARCVEHPFK